MLVLVLSRSSLTLLSLVGSDNPVLIKLLRDTGARHSFIVKSVLPFLPKTVLLKGMEIDSCHNMVLDCELVQGIVSVGVHPALPLYVDMILWLFPSR